MSKWKKAVLTSWMLLGMLSGCENTVEETTVTTAQRDEMFTERDLDPSYDEENSVRITLNGASAEADSDSVQISEGIVTISAEGTYIISGTLDEGQIVVRVQDSEKVQLVLDEATIQCADSAALYVAEGDKVFVTLAAGTENALINGGTFADEQDESIDGALFSRQDLTINGSGTLHITSPAGHGIVCNDDLVLTGGTISVSSASHGLKANDSVRMTGALTLSVDAGKDGIHAENDEDDSLGFVYIEQGTLSLEAEGDGLSASAYMQILDGTFAITAGGGSVNGTKESSDQWGGFMDRGGGPQRQMSESEQTSSEDDSTSMKGLKAAGDLTIVSGTFQIDSANDAVHANASITVRGGTFDITTGDDGMHADDTLTITDGTIAISESYEGLEALHVDIQGGNITLTSSDDGLNAAGGTDASGTEGGRDGMFGGGGMSASSDGTITISGGILNINASGDGIDANGMIEITGGYTVVCGPTQGDTATLDYDTAASISGGTFIGTGASGMAQTFSDAQQGLISVSLNAQTEGTAITLTDQDGNEIISHIPELSYAVIILSSPDIISGETYTLTAGTVSGSVTAE